VCRGAFDFSAAGLAPLSERRRKAISLDLRQCRSGQYDLCCFSSQKNIVCQRNEQLFTVSKIATSRIPRSRSDHGTATWAALHGNDGLTVPCCRVKPRGGSFSRNVCSRARLPSRHDPPSMQRSFGDLLGRASNGSQCTDLTATLCTMGATPDAACEKPHAKTILATATARMVPMGGLRKGSTRAI
jgi:hypothetical protein